MGVTQERRKAVFPRALSPLLGPGLPVSHTGALDLALLSRPLPVRAAWGFSELTSEHTWHCSPVSGCREKYL